MGKTQLVIEYLRRYQSDYSTTICRDLDQDPGILYEYNFASWAGKELATVVGRFSASRTNHLERLSLNVGIDKSILAGLFLGAGHATRKSRAAIYALHVLSQKWCARYRTTSAPRRQELFLSTLYPTLLRVRSARLGCSADSHLCVFALRAEQEPFSVEDVNAAMEDSETPLPLPGGALEQRFPTRSRKRKRPPIAAAPSISSTPDPVDAEQQQQHPIGPPRKRARISSLVDDADEEDGEDEEDEPVDPPSDPMDEEEEEVPRSHCRTRLTIARGNVPSSSPVGGGFELGSSVAGLNEGSDDGDEDMSFPIDQQGLPSPQFGYDDVIDDATVHTSSAMELDLSSHISPVHHASGHVDPSASASAPCTPTKPKPTAAQESLLVADPDEAPSDNNDIEQHAGDDSVKTKGKENEVITRVSSLEKKEDTTRSLAWDSLSSKTAVLGLADDQAWLYDQCVQGFMEAITAASTATVYY
ncbi:hypothetical protein PG994_000881 [Apiospora phragmitis]|uniref:Uncharacterized protein n=1 Tax=Apiospora phragmitis TaxID=2905665 RepID=A0ABR1WQT7_9PEZI